MNYFEIKVNPLSEGGSDVVVVSNFHPKWKECVETLLEGRIVKLMNSYSDKVEEWSRIPIDLEFSEHGLSHIVLPNRGGLDLFLEEEQYRSHNINTAENVGVVLSVATQYIYWLNFVLRRSE